MYKLSGHKKFVITMLLIASVLLSIYSYNTPNARAAQLSPLAEKGLTIINQTIGIDLNKYTITSALNANGLYRNTLPSEDLHYILTSSGSKIEVLETFANGSLVMIDILQTLGSPLMALPDTSPLLMARSFLIQYASNTGNQFYGELSAMLNNIEVTRNYSKVIGNFKFDINYTNDSNIGQTTTFTWSFTANGVNCPSKCVSLCYINGFLKDFIDTWNLYKVGSTVVNISKQQAEIIAMQKAKTFTWTDGSGSNLRIINNFNLTKPMYKTLVFCEAGNSTDARNADPLMTYPMWRIGVGLDKYYPGNVYGIYVDIWADSGEVRGIQVASTNLPPPNATIASITDCSINAQTDAISTISKTGIAILPVFILVAIGAMYVLLTRNHRLLRLQPLSKTRKAGATILCLLIGSIAVISALPFTCASGTSNIWGANSAGNPYLVHSQSERYYQGILSSYIDYLFWTCGYNNNNYQGSQTVPSNVLNYTNSAEQNEGIATVYFDHGIGMKNGESQPLLDPQLRIPNYASYDLDEWHYMLAGSYAIPNISSGNTFDYQIYDATTPNYNYFNWISTCLSADLGGRIPLLNGTGTYGPNSGGTGAPIGMPYAWTHILTTEQPVEGAMSFYGYWSPDYGQYCYIGFPYGSPSLSQTIDDEYPTALYYDFVHSFFYNTLSLQMTVKQALDAASLAYWAPHLFCTNKLAYNFTAQWDTYQDGYDCYMNVYGNTNMYLYAGGPDYASPPSVSGPTAGDSYTEYWFNAPSTDPMGHSLTYTFDWGDGSSPTITSDPYDVPHTWYSSGVYPISVTAQSDTGVCSSPTYYYIGIDQEPTLEVGTFDQIGNGLAANILVDNNWIGCGYGSTPVSIGWHYIEVDSWVWDDYYSTYVFPVSGNGWVFVGPDTYIHVYYAY
jgi:hypothetical protein